MSYRWRRLSTALLALTVVIVCHAAAMADEDLSNETCLGCHGTEGFSGPDGRVLFTDAEAFHVSVHGSLTCRTCHKEITSVPHTEKVKRPDIDTCPACHKEQVSAYRDSIHGRASSQGIKEAASCADCHGNIHAMLSYADAKSAAHWANLAVTCARCHANIELTQRFGIPVVRPVGTYLESAHARAVAAGKAAAVCSDCHGAHNILPGTDPRSSICRASVSETCGKCHPAVFTAYRESVHGKAAMHGASGAPVCTDCHGEHRILPHSEPASPVYAANIPRETCGRCHADERLSRRYGLSVQKVAAFEDSYHGLALRAGRPTVANCSSCHGVHDIFRSSDPRSRVHPANLPRTCGECHPGARIRSSLGSVHGAANALGTQAVHWIRLLYLCLIIGAIGLMAGHNFLDFVKKLQHPIPPPPAVPSGESERMPRPLRWQHGLVIVSFALLAYSGFALNYPESWWAVPLLLWEPQLPLRGLLHRAAAAVMMAAILWHVGQLAASRRRRACMHGIWPTLKDLKTLGAMLAYYFGRRRTRPHMGKFSYIEKAEYWTFMWGTSAMTISGLLLWFVTMTMRFLPNWVPDVATAIHFYEAILATASLLVWHFYWVVFDPDVYPVDWSFWTGNSPASRVLQRSEAPPSPEGTRPSAADPAA